MRKSLLMVILFGSVTAWACANDTAATRAIYIGDSHSVDGFGPQLQKMVDRSSKLGSAEVLRYAVSGSAADHWFPATNQTLQRLHIDYFCSPDHIVNHGAVPSPFPSFPQALSGQTPKGIVIALGTNDLDNGCNYSPRDPNDRNQKIGVGRSSNRYRLLLGLAR